MVEITKLVEYVHSKENPLIRTVKTHQHITNSTMLPTARRLKRELQRGTRQIKYSITGKKKDGEGRRCMGENQVHIGG
jgi:phosphatidate phosphatase PAH1